MTNPPADQFRLRDTWRSPRGKDWHVDKVEGAKARLRALHNTRTTRWCFVWNTGRNMNYAWERIDPPTEP